MRCLLAAGLSLSCFALVGCQGEQATSEGLPVRQVLPRLESAELPDSIWQRTGTIHLRLELADGNSQDIYMPRVAGGAWFRGIPSEASFVLFAEGTDSSGIPLWSGRAAFIAGTTSGIDLRTQLVLHLEIVDREIQTAPVPRIDSSRTRYTGTNWCLPMHQTQYFLDVDSDAVVHYTLDGSTPSYFSPAYSSSKGLIIEKTGVLKASTFVDGEYPSNPFVMPICKD